MSTGGQAFENFAGYVRNMNPLLQQVVLSYAGLSNDQKNYINSCISAASAIDILTESQAKDIISKTKLGEETQKAIMSKASEIAQTDGLTTAVLKKAAADVLGKGSMEASAAATKIDTAAKVANMTITEQLTVSAKALWAVLMNNPLYVIAAAVVAATVAIIAFSKAMGEAASLDSKLENLEAAKSEYEDIANAVSETTSAIEDNNDRVRELIALRNSGSASIVEEEELSRLLKENEALERKLRIQQELQRVAKEEANNAAVDALRTFIDSKYEITDKDPATGNPLAEGVTMAARVSQTQELQNAIEKYQELEQASEKLELQQDELAKSGQTQSKQYQLNAATLETYSSQMASARSYAAELADQIAAQADNLDENTTSGKAWLDVVNPLLDSYDAWLDDIDGISISERMSKALDTGKLTDASSALKELYDAGEMTGTGVRRLAEEYESLASFLSSNKLSASDFAEYYHALIGGTDAIDYDQYLSNIGNQFVEQQVSAVEKAREALEKMGAALESPTIPALPVSPITLSPISYSTDPEGYAKKEWEEFTSYLSSEDKEIIYTISIQQDTSGWTIDQWRNAFSELSKDGDYFQKKLYGVVDAFANDEQLTGAFAGLESSLSSLSDMYDQDFAGVSFNDDVVSEGENLLKSIADAAQNVGYVCDGSSESVEDLVNKLADAGAIRSVRKLGEEINDLWESEDFSDAKADLADLATGAGITANDISSLAKENAALSNILSHTGMSASYLAQCFTKMLSGADIFSLISADALRVNEVLGRTRTALQGVDSAYNDYQSSLDSGDYNDQFNNIQAAYESLGEMFESGTYGKDFYRTIEYLFGEGHSTDSIDELFEAYKKLGSVFSEADNGLSFLSQLYSKQGDNDWVSLEDGAYNFDIPLDDYERVSEVMGLTYDQVVACIEALGMFGDFSELSTSELLDTFSDLNMAVKDSNGNSILAKQGVENLLDTLGLEGFQIEQIIEDLKDTDGIQILDYDFSTADGISGFIDSLKELGMIDISDAGIQVSTFIESLDKLGLSRDNISSIMDTISSDLGIGWLDASGNVITYEDAVAYATAKTSDAVSTSTEEIKKYAESVVENANKIFGTDYEFDFNASGDDLESQIENVTAMLETLRNEDGSIDIEADGYDEASYILSALLKQKQSLEDVVIMKVDTSTVSGSVSDLIKKLQEYHNLYNQREIAAAIGADTTQLDSDLAAASSDIQSWADQNSANAEILAQLHIDTTQASSDIDATISSITSASLHLVGVDYSSIIGETAPDMDGIAKYTVDDTAVQSFLNANHDTTATIKYSANMSSVSRSLSNYRNESGTLTYRVKYVGLSKASGTAFASGSNRLTGSAFSSGRWGTQSSGIALMGELGPELIVRNGTFFTVGNDSAELVPYKKNDIIFNAEQTRQILANGRIATGAKRGVAYYNGTAFASGSVSLVNPATGKTYPTSGSSSSKKQSSGSNKKKSSGSSANDFAEDIDWIETLLDRLERRIKSLQTTAEYAYISFTTRNTALKNQLSEIQNEIVAQETAYKKYMQEANNIGLSSNYKELIKYGTLDIETITDENLAEKIKKYKELYEKALDAQQTAKDLRTDRFDTLKELFDNIVSRFDFSIDRINRKIERFETDISLMEAKGYAVSSKYYSAMISSENSKIASLKSEQSSLIQQLNASLDSGYITLYSEEWYNMQSQIDDVTDAIKESELAVQEYKNEIQQIKWDKFDYGQEKINDLTNEADFLIDLFKEQDFYASDGSITDAGLSTMALHIQNLKTYQKSVSDYSNEIKTIRKQLTSDPYNITLRDRLQELVEAQQNVISSAEAEKQALIDVAKQGIEAELSSLDDLISAYEDSLDSAKNLYEYQKKIGDQAKNISQIEKQLSALSLDTSEENKKTIQELKVSLEDAKTELQETQYDQYVADQKELLSSLYDEYESILNSRLDDVDALINTCISTIEANGDLIGDSIMEAANSAGYSISNEMSSVWGSGSPLMNVLNSISASVNSIYNAGDSTASKDISNNSQLDKNNSTVATGTPGGSTNKKPSTNTTQSGTSSNQGSTTKPQNTTSKPSSSTSHAGLVSSITSTLKKGSTGNNVKKLQQALNALGFKGKNGKTLTVDGQFQTQTDYAVKKFQSSTKYGGKISADGIVGSITRGKFKRAGYRSGVRNVPADQVTWISETGNEMIVRPTENAILTSLRANDSVLNARATQNIWNMANNPSNFIRSHLPGIVSGVSNGNMQNDVNVTFNLPNVRNYAEFLNEMRSDDKFESLIKSITLDQLAGKSRLSKNKIKW